MATILEKCASHLRKVEFCQAMVDSVIPELREHMIEQLMQVTLDETDEMVITFGFKMTPEMIKAYRAAR